MLEREREREMYIKLTYLSLILHLYAIYIESQNIQRESYVKHSSFLFSLKFAKRREKTLENILKCVEMFWDKYINSTYISFIWELHIDEEEEFINEKLFKISSFVTKKRRENALERKKKIGVMFWDMYTSNLHKLTHSTSICS